MSSVLDAFNQELTIGDEVVCITSPTTLQRGVITGVSKNNRFLTTVEIVVDRQDKQTATLKVASFMCAKR
ncbi:MAG: hypothetical protein NDI90_15520 [Nitrospira sp. BO4]|jgi:hypothetical protein|nr:hypothetical protein [Nitrospira sp. BO4]